MKKRFACVLMLMLVLLASALPVRLAAAEEITVSTGVIVGDNIALRATASSSGALLTRLKEGTIVKVLACNVNSEWYKVEAGKRTGYVNRLYLNIDAGLPAYQQAYIGTIANCQSEVNVRSDASLKGKKLGKAKKGDTFAITQAYVNGSWHGIDYNGQTAYVSAQYVDLTAKVEDGSLSDIVVTGGTLSPAFSPSEYGYTLTATDEQVTIKAIANKGVRVSVGDTGVASSKYTIRSGNSKTVRISVGGKVKYSIYIVRDVLTVGTWNIKRGNENLLMQGWLIDAQRPDILGVQEVYVNEKENVNNLLSVRTKRASYISFAQTISYSGGGQYGVGQLSRFKPVSTETVLLESGKYEQRCVQKVVYEIDKKKVSVYNTHFSYESAAIRKKQFDAVLKLMDADTNPYKILTGDFNAKESEFSAFRKNYTIVNTSSTKFYDYAYKRIDMSQIDNIIVSKNITVLNARAIPTNYSDHYPLFAFLRLK